jgi:cephalosporin-C deacetylase
MKTRLYLIMLLLPAVCAWSQPAEPLVKIFIRPDRPDWNYRPGEKARFDIQVWRAGTALADATLKYEIGPEQMPPAASGEVKLNNGSASVGGQSLGQPGFLRCAAETEVDGRVYRAYTIVAYAPESIQPTTTMPADFEAFWQAGKAELAKIPIEPVLTLLPERCTDKVDVYHVRMNNIRGYVYGILCKPKSPGKYPALLNVPGAGIRPYYGDVERAARGIITLQIGIHGIPVNLSQEVYDALGRGALSGWPQGYPMSNLDDREQYYFRRVYLGCARAADFLASLPEFDGENLAVTGGSQGGALSIVTAGLDARVKYLAAVYPALSDLTGYLHDRAGGWPHMFKKGYSDWTISEKKIETSRYFDVANFARLVKVPGFYTWGYNDNVCPPTSMHAAYNVIPGPKELALYKDAQHWTYPEQRQMVDEWLLMKLGR